MKLSRRIKINHQWVGDKDDPCFIIAEAGSNHNRNIKTAKRLIDVAKKAGADAVKFQTYYAKTLYPKSLQPLRLLGEKTKPFDVIKKIELPRGWHKELARYAKKRGIIFLSTPFDKEAIDELYPLVPAFKWASPELVDKPLLEYVAKKGKPLIISTGFYSEKEVKEAIQWVKRAGNSKVVLLQCTGLYPTSLEDENLNAMQTMQKKFRVLVGLSDHTMSTIIPAAAVAMGAKVVEKHFTLSRKSKGPDHPFALEPKELKVMVQNIRDVEKALGDGIKKPVPFEIKKERLIRRGLVSKKHIKKGEKLSFANIITKRVGTGFKGALLPKGLDTVIGKKASKNILEDTVLTKKDFS